MRLLVTRPEPDAARFAKDLEAMGIEAVVQPLLKFQALDYDPRKLADANALIVTSANGLRGEPSTVLSHVSHSIPVFCVGTETARQAAELGLSNIVVVAGTAQELARLIKDSAASRYAFVHLAGEHQAFDLEGDLSASSISIKTIRVYTMRQALAFDDGVLDRFKKRHIDGVSLMSARTADIYCQICRKAGLEEIASELDHFCLSHAIAKRLAFIAAEHLVVPRLPMRADFMALLANAAKKRHSVIA